MMPKNLKVDISKRPIDPKNIITFPAADVCLHDDNEKFDGASTLTSIGLASPKSSIGERKPLYSSKNGVDVTKLIKRNKESLMHQRLVDARTQRNA